MPKQPGQGGTQGGRNRRPTSTMELAYAATLTAQQAKQHHTATRFPSGRPSKGGANRSSNIKRVVHQSTQQVDVCTTCGGVAPEVLLLTEMWEPCSCFRRPPRDSDLTLAAQPV